MYNHRTIATELDLTARGVAYFGNALRVAKDLPCVTQDDRSLLDRWATGKQEKYDGFRLQDLSIKIWEQG